MKVRGINKGGPGDWSEHVVGQFKKSFPQKPKILSLHLRATMGVVAVQIPEPICPNESPITCLEIGYVSVTDDKWSNYIFEIELVKVVCSFTVTRLELNTQYNFRVRTKNAEGCMV